MVLATDLAGEDAARWPRFAPRAVDNRDMIGQAKGILVERFGIDGDAREGDADATIDALRFDQLIRQVEQPEPEVLVAPTDVTPPEISWGESTVGRSTVMLVRCSGEIDRSNAYLLRSAVHDAVWASCATTGGAGGGRVVVDLTGMTFAAAAVVDALVEATGGRGAGSPVRLVIDGNRHLEMAARTTDLHETFRLYEDVEAGAAGAPELAVPGAPRGAVTGPSVGPRGVTTRRP